MKASPLGNSLRTLLRDRSVNMKDIDIVVDNAVRPTHELVDQVLEHVIMVDAQRSKNIMLGLSCTCLRGEDDDDESIQSEEDSFEGHYSTDEDEQSIDAIPRRSRWEASARVVEKGSLVMPSRSCGFSVVRNSAPRLAPRRPSKTLPLTGPPQATDRTRDLTYILDEAISISQFQN